MSRFNDTLGRAGSRLHDDTARQITVLNAPAVGGRETPSYSEDANSPVRGTTRRPSGGDRETTTAGGEQTVDIEIRTYNETGATLRGQEGDAPPTRCTVGGKTVEVVDVYEEGTGLLMLDCVEVGPA